MMRHTYRCSHYALSVLLLMFFTLVGCGAPVTQYYVLDTISAVKNKQASIPPVVIASVAIRQVEIPRYLDRPRMLSRDAGNHLRISESHQWGGRLRDNITRTLADNLAERLAPASISSAPFPGSMQAEVSLLVDIRQFERLADGRVHLKVRWHMHRRGKAIQTRLQHMQSDVRVGESDYAMMAAAMSRLLAQLSGEMAVAIRHLPASPSL